MKNLITNKKIFYSGLVYFICILLFIGARILWGTGFLSGIDPLWGDLIFSIVIQLVILTALPLLLWKTLCKQTFKQTAEHFFIRKISFRTIVYSILLGILVYVLIIFVSTFWSLILSFFGYSPSGGGTTTDLPVWLAFIVSIVSTSFLPGFGEEMAHRGMLLGNARGNGLKRAILITALMFALAHLNISQAGYAFVVGLILGASTLITRSIWPAVIIHATSNFCSVYMSFAEANGWLGGSITSTMTNFITQNWLAGLIVSFLILMIVLTLIAIIISRFFEQTKYKRFQEFCTRLKSSVAGTQLETEIDFNDKLQLYTLYSQAAAKDLKDKVESGQLPISHLEKEVGNNPLYSMLYSEFDEYKKPNSIDYLFYYITIFMAGIVTIITLIWGIL